MGEPVKTEMVFVKEECGGVEVKMELVEEQDPLSLEGSSILEYDFMQFLDLHFYKSSTSSKCKHMHK